MLVRQKVLLALVSGAPVPAPKTLVVKLAFLMRKETFLANTTCFYDFLPYRFGPFSFLLYRDIAALQAAGFLSAAGSTLSIEPASSILTEQLTGSLPEAFLAALRAILSRYARVPLGSLVRDVYTRYPWYATRSGPQGQFAHHQSEVAVPKTLYTTGYAGRSVDGVLDVLLAHGVRRLVDIRANPISRKYGFSKATLSNITLKLGLAYDHFPSLGIPTQYRRRVLSSLGVRGMLDRYQETLVTTRKAELLKLVPLVRGSTCSLLCVESDPGTCHRDRLAQCIGQLIRLPVADI